MDGKERGQKKTDDLRAMTSLGPRTLLRNGSYANDSDRNVVIKLRCVAGAVLDLQSIHLTGFNLLFSCGQLCNIKFCGT